MKLPLEQKALGVCGVCKKQIIVTIKGDIEVPKGCTITNFGVNIGVVHQNCAIKKQTEQEKKQAPQPSLMHG